MRPLTLWEGERLTYERSFNLTLESLHTYGSLFRHWAIAFSGGKDSTTVVTLVASLMASGAIPPPETLTVLYADTRMELPPLQATAMRLLAELQQRGIATQVVLPALDHRYFVYMFGRGVPPPKNRRFRWCTPRLKIEPMEEALVSLRQRHPEKFLLLTGVRMGESAVRDQRIALSCSKDGAECGQGWFQHATPQAVADVLAPCLHWRVCHIWDWLTFHASQAGFSTQMIAEVLRKFSNDGQQLVFYPLRVVEDIVFPKQIQSISFTVSYQSFTLIICKIALLNRLEHMRGVEPGVSVPERSVTFDKCLDLRDIKVENSRLDTILPDISNIQAIKRTCKRFLQIIVGFSGASIDDLLYRSLRYPLSASRVSKLSLGRISELDFGCIRKAFTQPMIRRFSLNGYSRGFECFAQGIRCGVILFSYVFHRFTALVLLSDDVKWQLLATPQIRALSRTIDTCITIMPMRAMLSSSQGLTALAAKEGGGLRCTGRTDWDIQVAKPSQNRSRTNAQFFTDGSIPHVLNDIQIIQDIINGATTPLLDIPLCLFSDLTLWRGTVLNHLPFLAFSLNIRALTSSFGVFLDKAHKAEKEEINARTGCIGCNLASKDVALDTLLKMPQWAYLAPLKRLKPLYQHLIKPQYRLRKDGTDRRKDGTLADNPMRLGPLTMAARREGLAQVLDIQQQVNDGAHVQGRPCIDLINEEEHARILTLIEANTWPEKWTGEEVRGDVLLDQVLADGVLQPLLVGGDR
nr:phosphoadenosine phosphosulfate reductase family protein [Ktedonobacteraceae bacterium]